MKKLDLIKMRSRVIPVFYACDDGYVKYLTVSLKSLIEHSSVRNNYDIHILHTDISLVNQRRLRRLANAYCTITFDDVSKQLQKVSKKLSLRDYYSSTTYYRIFIPDLYPKYDKVLYIDGDTVVMDDVAKLFQYHLGENYIGAVRENLVITQEIYGAYVERVLGISRNAYFNAGVVMLNCRLFRKKNVLKQFVDMLNTYAFVVAQDQDYLNIICKDKVFWLDTKWNIQMTEDTKRTEKNLGIIHYNLASKPWHYTDCMYGEYFWRYARLTDRYDELRAVLENFTEADKEKDIGAGNHLMSLAVEEINNDHNYLRMFAGEDHTISRLEILDKIRQYEKEGRFDEDVEEDPPSRTLMPNEIDYLKSDMTHRMTTMYAFRIAHWYVSYLRSKKLFILKDILGTEYLQGLDSGAIITCNHFHPFDSFVAQLAFEKAQLPRKKFFRVIKEGNYTNFPGFYGFLMRNCNTLPLSSNRDTMKKFMRAVDEILTRGHYILVYPEQSMWWNYRKPKPLKKGAFNFASRNNVPVVPFFVTMEDTEYKDFDGLAVQAYTVHICPPIYPDPNKSRGENTEDMLNKNYEVWKQVYEETYQIPLTYETEDPIREAEEELASRE